MANLCRGIRIYSYFIFNIFILLKRSISLQYLKEKSESVQKSNEFRNLAEKKNYVSKKKEQVLKRFGKRTQNKD
jgi:hypothetical protein